MMFRSSTMKFFVTETSSAVFEICGLDVRFRGTVLCAKTRLRHTT